MATNAKLVAAFTAARKLIASNQESFICHALENCGLHRAIREDATKIIQDRLAGHSVASSWLHENVPGAKEYIWSQGQSWVIYHAYRLRWLDSLIAEFS